MAEEVAHRAQTRIQRCVRRAHFRFLKTIDEYDFTLQAGVRLALLGSALSPEFVTQGQTLILSGPSGTGKTHLAVAIAYRAIQNGFEARFTSATALIARWPWTRRPSPPRRLGPSRLLAEPGLHAGSCLRSPLPLLDAVVMRRVREDRDLRAARDLPEFPEPARLMFCSPGYVNWATSRARTFLSRRGSPKAARSATPGRWPSGAG
jgi:hypothetical protein